MGTKLRDRFRETEISRRISSGADWISAKAVSAKKRFISGMTRVKAYFHRYGFLAVWLLLLVGVAALALTYLFASAENSLLPSRLLQQLLPKEATDTKNANLYYVVNIIFVPLQTLLLLIGGLYAWRTLSQNRKFKQHDAEASCVRDYLAIEKQLADAGCEKQKIESAVRAYWILMVYEYYWWRRGLLSRDLFAVWCEFRVQRFRRNAAYAFKSDEPSPPFKDYVSGYEHCSREKVFRSDSKFDKLMKALRERADGNADNLRWYEIEKYRHGWFEVF